MRIRGSGRLQKPRHLIWSSCCETNAILKTGLVDEFQVIVCPVVVDSGKRFFPDGVRLDLALVEERRFRKGVIVLRYAVCG